MMNSGPGSSIRLVASGSGTSSPSSGSANGALPAGAPSPSSGAARTNSPHGAVSPLSHLATPPSPGDTLSRKFELLLGDQIEASTIAALKGPFTKYFATANIEDSLRESLEKALQGTASSPADLSTFLGPKLSASKLIADLKSAKTETNRPKKDTTINALKNDLRGCDAIVKGKQEFLAVFTAKIHHSVKADATTQGEIQQELTSLSAADKKTLESWVTDRINQVISKELEKKLLTAIETPIDQLVGSRSEQQELLGKLQPSSKLNPQDIEKWIGFKELNENDPQQNTLKNILRKTGLIPGEPGYVSPQKFKFWYNMTTVCAIGSVAASSAVLFLGAPLGVALVANVGFGIVNRFAHNWLARKTNQWNRDIMEGLSKTKDMQSGMALSGLAYKFFTEYEPRTFRTNETTLFESLPSASVENLKDVLLEAARFSAIKRAKIGDSPSDEQLYFSDQRFNDIIARGTKQAADLTGRWMSWPASCDAASSIIGTISGLRLFF